MQQLRIYTINRGKMAEFVRLWRQGIAPIREKIGFRIVGAWVIKETNQFAWLLNYDGPEEWAVKDREYFDSPERRELKPDPAQWIARTEQYFVDPVKTGS
ncbi:MAG: NIPSNAP family protein [Omnitrophica WOR_2 bacterium]